MGQKLLVILVLLLMVRPITLVENLTCSEETAVSANSEPVVPDPIPNQEIPCSDIVNPSEIVASGHPCLCFALMQPDPTGIRANINSFALIATHILSAETAVANPPTPPPRLV
jgi:hypothetical protein